MNLAALFSGGKDSCFAVHDMIRKGHSVKYLITMLTENRESYMFHYPNLKFTGHQAESMGIKQILWKTKGEKEKELFDLKRSVESVRKDVDGVIAGGLASRYQYNRIKSINDSLGLESIAPHWHIDPEKYWEMILRAGFRVMIVGVACEGLGKEWLGRVIDREAYRELRKLSEKHRFHLAFEGGEAETFVLDGPGFGKRIEIRDAERVWDRDSGFYLFRKVRLAGK